MKPKLSIILSAIALIVLLIVQYYNISVTFQTKKEQFDNHYGAIIKQGLYEYESGATGYLSDSVFILFDNISEELVFQSGQVPGGLASDSLQQQIRASYNKILRDHTSPDAYLQDYLVKAGADPDFRSGFYIRELSLLDFDRIVPVYNDTTGQQPASLRNALQANTYAFEGNYFMIRYDYYIDFTHKTQIIYRDKIAIMGYSSGGIISLLSSDEKIRKQLATDTLKFAAHINVYAGTIFIFKNAEPTKAPMLFLSGEKDNTCPVEKVMAYAQRLKDAGGNISTIVYPGAHHVFDAKMSTKTVTTTNDGNCQFEILDDGNLVDSATGGLFPEKDYPGDHIKPCSVKKATFGRNMSAAKKYKIDAIDFLMNALQP